MTNEEFLKKYNPSALKTIQRVEDDEEEKLRKGFLKEGVSFLADIAIAEGGRIGASAGGAAIGTAILPGFGTLIGGTLGYIAGGLGAGAAGSIARQKMFDPNADVSEGQVVADALLNLVPGSGIGKTVMRKAAAQAGIGASMSVGGQLVERAIEEGRLPTQEELSVAGLTGAALGGALGLSGSASEKAFGKFLGKPIDNLNAALKAGDPDAKALIGKTNMNAREYADKTKERYEEFYLRNREKYDDEFIRAKVLQNKVAGGFLQQKGKLVIDDDSMDYTMKRANAEGRIDAKINQVEADIALENGFLLDVSQRVGLSAPQISKEINDYMYAKHAIAYNKNNFGKFGEDGAAGISTEKAQKIVENFEAAGKDKTYDFSIKVRKDLSKQILNTLEDGQIISKAEAAKLRKDAPDYVPLNRIMDEDPLDDVSGFINGSFASKYETKNTGIRRAFGSNRDVTDINQNIVNSLSGAIRRAETNKVNLAFKAAIESPKNKEAAEGIAKIRKPTKTKKARTTKGREVRVLDEERAGDHVVTVFDKGEKLFIEFDPNFKGVAAAMKGLNRKQVSDVMKWSMTANRYLGGLYTRYNPEFMIPNLTRDRSEAFVAAMAKMGPTKVFDLINPAKITEDMNVIRRNLMNSKKFKETPDLMNENDLLYKRFQEAGGSTGGLSATTIDDLENNIAKLGEKLNAPAASKANKFNKIIEGINEIFEDSTRFSTFKVALKNGATDEQAAYAARKSSFDPRERGTETDNLKAMYLFVNPAIQGGKNFLRSMKNPKTFATVMGGLGASATALDIHNSSIDENYREKIPQWKLDKHLTFVTGKNEDGSLKYLSVPIGYSMVPFKMAADLSVQMFKGGSEVKDLDRVTNRFVQGVMDSYNPIGGSPIPTQMRPIVDLLSNQDGLGRDIRPEWMETINMDPTERRYDHTADTYGGELAMGLADSLADMGYETSPENIKYLFNNYLGGPGKFFDRLGTVTSKLYNGEKIGVNEIPLARRFFGQTFVDKFERRTGRMADIDTLDKEANTNSIVAGRISREALKEMRDNPKRMDSILQKTLRNNPNMQESLLRRIRKGLKDEARGLDYVDRAAKRLPVEQRAKYISDQLSQQPDEESRNSMIRELIQKGIASKTVLKELLQLQQLQELQNQ